MSVKRRLRADKVATDKGAPNQLIGSRSKICPPKLSTHCFSHIVVCGRGLFCTHIYLFSDAGTKREIREFPRDKGKKGKLEHKGVVAQGRQLQGANFDSGLFLKEEFFPSMDVVYYPRKQEIIAVSRDKIGDHFREKRGGLLRNPLDKSSDKQKLEN